MIFKHLETGVAECISETGIARIHPGDLSKEEEKAFLEDVIKRVWADEATRRL